jgi:hypothetical protein
MASNHIEINGSSRFSGKVRGLIDSTRSIANQASEVLAICNAYLGSNPNLTLDATYSDLAVALGLVGATANADAHTFYTLLIASQGRLTGPAISNFIDQLG